MINSALFLLKLSIFFLLASPVLRAQSNSASCLAFRQHLPSNFIQGFVQVPENWAQPTGAQISVFYYGKRDPSRPTIAFFNGGPTLDSHNYFMALNELPYVKDLPIIFIDQRGTGCSSAYPTSPVNAENLARIELYGARSIVKDAEVIRKSLLGADSYWQIAGHSNGSFIVHRYVELFPEHIISAHGYGFALMSDMAQWRMYRIFSQKRVFAEYLKVYPGDDLLLKKLHELVAQLPSSSQCFTQGTTSVCGQGIIDALATDLADPTKWSTLHKIVISLFDNGQLSRINLEKFVQTLIFGSFWGHYFPFYSLLKLEMATPFGSQPACRIANERLIAMGEHPYDWPINECRLSLSVSDPSVVQMVDSSNYSDPANLTMFAQGLASFPRLAFYLYSGQLDAIVPMESFAEEINFVGSRIHYKNFQNEGHYGIFVDPQFWNDIREVNLFVAKRQ